MTLQAPVAHDFCLFAWYLFLFQAVCMNFNRIMGVYIRQSVQGQSCWSLEKALFLSCLYFSRLGLNQTYHQNTLPSTQALHVF